MKKLQRFLTALMTLMFIAPSYSAMAADVPTDLYLRGHVDNHKWDDYKVQQTYKDGNTFYFNANLTGDSGWDSGNSSTFSFVDSNNVNYEPGTNGNMDIKNNVGTSDYKWAHNMSTSGGGGYLLNSGQYTFKVVFDDNGNASLWVKSGHTQFGDPEPAKCPDQLYILGHINGKTDTDWGTGVIGEKNGDKFYFNNITFSSYTNGNGRSTFGFSENSYRPDGNQYYGRSGDGPCLLDGNKNPMSIVTTGGWEIYGGDNKYDIVVDFSDVNNPYFTITEQEEPFEGGTVPEKFYIFGNIEGKNGWNGDGTPLSFTTRDEESGIIIFSGVQLDGSFAFCSEEGKNGDDCKNHAGYLGSNVTEGDAEIGIGEKGLLYSKTGHGYKPKDNGTYDIVVYFPATGEPYFKLNKVEDWYFIGDINQWFSEEFTGGDQGLNADIFNSAKKDWKFEPADDPVLAAEGWLMFDKFPIVDGVSTLAGQFKIKDGAASWSGNEYVAPEDVTYANDDNYRAYHNNPLPAATIKAGEIFEGTVLVKKNAGTIKNAGGNLHLECNAVRNACIYFNPNYNGQPALRITGEPIDYFVFYTRGESVGTQEVRGRISSNNPNENNYYLPGVKGLENPGNGEHMNTGDGKHFTKIDLTKGESEILAQLEAAFPNASKYSAVNKTVFETIAKNKTLPNMVNISDRTFLYIEKIPNGFANPAGTRFNMTLNKSLDDESREIPTILSTKHIYFLPTYGAVHVHVNYDSMKGQNGSTKYKDYYDPEVSYRIYYTDNEYRRMVAGNTHMWPDMEGGEELEEDYYISKGNESFQTGSDKDPYVPAHWVVLDEYKNQSEWGKTDPFEYKNKLYYDWNVNWRNENVSPLAEDADNTTNADDMRLGIRSRYATAYVQFRVKLAHKSDASKDIVNYFPAKLDVQQDGEHYPIGGKDLYVVMDNDNDDGVWTGVDDIEIDYWYDGEEVEDNSVPVFYNLQGTKVANPSNGIFIMVKGGKSKKVFIK